MCDLLINKIETFNQRVNPFKIYCEKVIVFKKRREINIIIKEGNLNIT